MTHTPILVDTMSHLVFSTPVGVFRLLMAEWTE